jgi:hypothetical protein
MGQSLGPVLVAGKVHARFRAAILVKCGDSGVSGAELIGFVVGTATVGDVGIAPCTSEPRRACARTGRGHIADTARTGPLEARVQTIVRAVSVPCPALSAHKTVDACPNDGASHVRTGR